MIGDGKFLSEENRERERDEMRARREQTRTKSGEPPRSLVSRHLPCGCVERNHGKGNEYCEEHVGGMRHEEDAVDYYRGPRGQAR